MKRKNIIESLLCSFMGRKDKGGQPSAPDPVRSDPSPKSGKTYRVTGVSHYLDNLLPLAQVNRDYNFSKKDIIGRGLIGERICKYVFAVSPESVQLIPEPDNPHDPHAIKVVLMGNHVGYIKSGSCAHLLKVINGAGYSVLDCSVGGGPYKIVYENDDGSYELERDEYQYFVRLSILEK